MFKFGFQPEELNDEFRVDDAETAVATLTPTASIPCLKCEEIFITAAQRSQTRDTLKHGLILFAGGQHIYHVTSDVLLEDLVEEQIQQRLRDEREAREREASAAAASGKSAAVVVAEAHATDLIPGVYEGGGKIWECTQDLGDYLGVTSEESGRNLLEDLDDKNVLDLGCGAGILGLLALQHGANVYFQDYNPEIITKVTIPNAVLNNDAASADEPSSSQLDRCRFYAGDWSHFVQHLTDRSTAADVAAPQFDVILTCETIYNPDNNGKIIDALRRLLRPDTGVAYLAAKTYYFGVGGGLRAFEAQLVADGTLCSEVVWRSTENVQREILRITHRSAAAFKVPEIPNTLL